MHNKILSLFNYNLESDFGKTVLEKKSVVNFQGALINILTEKFADKKFKVFETIAVKDFGSCCNIILSSNKYSIFHLYNYKKLINELYKLLGNDAQKGKYSTSDFHDLADKEMELVILRYWHAIKDKLPECKLIVEKTENLIELTILEAHISSKTKDAWY